MRLESSSTLKVDTAAVVVLASAGTVRYDWAAADVDTAGDYIGWWEVTTAGKTQVSPQFTIDMFDPVAIGLSTRALVGIGETQAWLQARGAPDSGDLSQLTDLINSASETIYQISGREFKANTTNPATRSFDLDWYSANFYSNTVCIGDLAAFTSGTIANDAGTTLYTLLAADYSLRPRNRKPWEPYTHLRLTSLSGARGSFSAGNVLNITGTWGFPVVPEDIKHACMDAVAYQRDRDVEHPRQDMSAVPGQGEGQTLVVQQRPLIIPLPPEVYSTVIQYRIPFSG